MRICCWDKSQHNNHEPNTQYPTAKQRAKLAEITLDSSDDVTFQTAHSSNIHFLPDLEIARQISNLPKPMNPSKLLQHALTNANGEEWQHQRPVVSKAFGISKAYRTILARDIHDFVSWNNLVSSKNSLQKSDGVKEKVSIDIHDHASSSSAPPATLQIEDARELALFLASKAISHIVMGSHHGFKVENHLQNMFLPTLQPRRDGRDEDTSIHMNALDAIVRDCIKAEIQSTFHCDDNNDSNISLQDNSCLMLRLLHYQYKGKLSPEQVIGNIHSALMAGTQTTCTTILGALLHLADWPGYQKQIMCGEMSGKAIVNETLRIFPPVGGLPRVVSGPTSSHHLIKNENERDASINIRDGNDHSVYSVDEDDNHVTCEALEILSEGDTVILDLVGFAHAYNKTNSSQRNDDGDIANHDCLVKNNDMASSWNFCPRKKGEGNLTNLSSHAQPFGIGERRCPAGSLSVECVSSVIEGLTSQGISWRIDYDGRSNEIHKGSWMNYMSYCPTLTYKYPIHLVFEKGTDNNADL